MRTIIVDDEFETLEDIKYTLMEFEGIEIAGSYTNPLMALSEVEKTIPDCAFLDIEMPGMSGIDLADKLLAQNPQMEVVFITAFNHYATQAFEVNALDYVLKPIHPQRFIKTVKRLYENHQQATFSEPQSVRIQSLGGFDVYIGDSLVRWNRSKAKEMLAYLLHYSGQKKNKYKICEDLWPECDPKKALVNLQTAMCSLRKSLGSVGRDSIVIDFYDESYMLKLGTANWDVKDFEKLYTELMLKMDEEKALRFVECYQGDYMGNEDWSWSQLTAESLARKYEELLSRLAEVYYRDARFVECIDLIMKLLRRQVGAKDNQLMLLECAYRSGGVAALSHWAKVLQKLYHDDYDLRIDSEAVAYCHSKGILI
jgi:two-component SAPR family response regulator